MKYNKTCAQKICYANMKQLAYGINMVSQKDENIKQIC